VIVAKFRGAPRQLEQRPLVVAKHRNATRPVCQPVAVGGERRDPSGEIVQPTASKQRREFWYVGQFDRLSQNGARAIVVEHRGFPVFQYSLRRRNPRPQRLIAQQIPAKAVDGSERCGIDFSRGLSQTIPDERAAELSLQIGCRLIGIRDRRDLIERQRIGDPIHLPRFVLDRCAQQVAELLHDGRRLARPRAGPNEHAAVFSEYHRKLRLRQSTHRAPSTGPPGMRQISRAGQ
jgi:hypothetical protein